jgi:predicted transcriptional regulator YdeE
MKKHKTSMPEMTLVGISMRTNNKAEMNLDTGKIGPTVGQYFGEQLADSIKHRSQPGVTYAVYTDFESDETGEYTYLIGEAVESLEGQDLNRFSAVAVPASEYQKLTTEKGAMPKIIIDAWQKIWSMSEQAFEGKRRYIADFEVYDERAADPQNAQVDIFIGIE